MTVGKVRTAIKRIAPYRPGKQAKQAEAEHGISGAIKLASNENPYQPVPAVLEAIKDASSEMNRYGDHLARDLREAIAKWLSVDSSNVVTGCGSVGLLNQICAIYLDAGDEVVFPWPSFEAYPVAVKIRGAVPVKTELVDHASNLEAVAEAVGDKTKLVMLANPNNPTGTAFSVAEVTQLLETIPNNVVVVLDEAYREFADPALGDPLTLLDSHRNLIITRTFSKAYGLAGLRIGYAIADAEIVDELDKVLIPFSVNQLAQAGALAALENLDEIGVNVATILAERKLVVKELIAAGFDMPTTQANFVFLPTAEKTSELQLALERAGVVVRGFPNVGLRITIGTPEENQRLIRTLKDVADI